MGVRRSGVVRGGRQARTRKMRRRKRRRKRRRRTTTGCLGKTERALLALCERLFGQYNTIHPHNNLLLLGTHALPPPVIK